MTLIKSPELIFLVVEVIKVKLLFVFFPITITNLFGHLIVVRPALEMILIDDECCHLLVQPAQFLILTQYIKVNDQEEVVVQVLLRSPMLSRPIYPPHQPPNRPIKY
jgi:hypothetical protein